MKGLSLALVFVVLTISSATADPSAISNDLLFKSLPWRCIGPAIMGGRIDDFAVVESDPSTFYVATAAGGVFKTVNHGTTFEPIFDGQPCLSIGDVTVSQSHPEVVWVGTGEANNRQSSSWGDGVYKSLDAGKSWTYMGLPESRHIGRIVIDPQNSDNVFVACGGDLWAPSAERGVYKTSDGGKTWTRSLAINPDTGCTDLAMDPADPNTLYAAAYQRRRTPAGYNGGGPGSGIYKTTDGGAHWARLLKGLPSGDIGRIGLDIYRKNPSIVYACVENADGGIYRSEDRGETWKKMGAVNMGLNAFRPMYFSQIRVDPNNDQNLVLAGVNIGWSADGGKTFQTFAASRIHPDTHAIWIDPANSKHILVGCDGGVQWTFDQGKTWDFNNTLPIAQFYELAYDMRKPYWIYGGLQDNGSWGAPNMALSGRGITNADWMNIGGGDGFYCQADPVEPNTVYSESQQGSVSRLNVATGERKGIRPLQAPGDAPYRFDWNTPLLISPHNHNRIYLGGNRLFISDDRGDSWRASPDLSTNPDRAKMPIMGVLPSPKMVALNDGQESFGEIVTLSESAAAAGVLWAGTDDGNIQLSRDDGRKWRNVAERLPGVPRGTYVTRILASSFVPGRAYAALDGHRTGDYKAYLFVTEDFGETWQSLSAGIPDHYTVKAIREHPRNPALLFAGTERGAFVSLTRGASWTPLASPLPAVPVNDIQIHPRENDLILATHGRGVWILDDITPFEQLAGKSTVGSFLLCDPRPAINYRFSFTQSWGGNRVYTGDNPASGASIQYVVTTRVPAKATGKLTILDRSGRQVIAEFKNVSVEPGLHRMRWDMRYSGPAADGAPSAGLLTGADNEESDQTQKADEPDSGADGAALVTFRRGMFVCQTEQPTPQATTAQRPSSGQAAGPRGQGRRPGAGRGQAFGPRVLPGVYLVRLTIGAEERTRELRVEDDARVHISDRDRRALYALELRVMRVSQSYSEVRRSLTGLRTEVAALLKSDDLAKAPPAVKESLSALDKELLTAQAAAADGRQGAPKSTAASSESGQGSESGQTPRPPAQTGAILQRLNRLVSSLNGITEPPSKADRQEADALAEEIRLIVDKTNALVSSAVARENKTLADGKMTLLTIPGAAARPR